jgi:N-acetylmuramoyl-L-alanine amidase
VGYLAIHHSGVNVDSTALSIAEYHVNVMGWAEGIGYHWLVHWDGRIEYVGDVLTARANVAKRNREVIGICLPGNWNDDVPGDAQLGGALELVTWLRALLPWAEVRGHSDVALAAYPTTCPGLMWPAWRAVLG